MFEGKTHIIFIFIHFFTFLNLLLSVKNVEIAQVKTEREELHCKVIAVITINYI